MFNPQQLMLSVTQQMCQDQLASNVPAGMSHVNNSSNISPTTNSDIQIRLDNADLWQKFHQHTTEMIVNKTGRRMFPTLRFKIDGLEPSTSYAVFLEIAPSDECRYKYQNGRWLVNGRADPLPVSPNGGRCRLYAHPDSPAPGHLWMRQPLSFHRVKLTNNLVDPQGNVLLNSMHKYQPKLYILRLHDYFPTVPQLVAFASFPETTFVTVTAYQNNSIIQLKIDHNPFAKGFRENGLHGGDKKRSLPFTSTQCDQEDSIVKRTCSEENENQIVGENAFHKTPDFKTEQPESALNKRCEDSDNLEKVALPSSSPARSASATGSSSICPTPPNTYSPVNIKQQSHGNLLIPTSSPFTGLPFQSPHNPLASPFYPALNLATAAGSAFTFPSAAFSGFHRFGQLGCNPTFSAPPDGVALGPSCMLSPPQGIVDPARMLLAAATGFQGPTYLPPVFLPRV